MRKRLLAARLSILCQVFLFFSIVLPAWADAARPRIAIIIDDLGYLKAAGKRAVELDGPVAYAILPNTPHGAALAKQARRLNKEILLHLPLQAIEQVAHQGRSIINIDTTHRQLAEILSTNLASVPYVIGVSTHMGSLLTQHPGHMAWLMDELRERGDLLFVDSYTTPDSVALRLAHERGIPAVRRNVFLDNEINADHIAAEFQRLKKYAHKHGTAVAIGHPYASTLSLLEAEIPTLADEGIDLVAISELVSVPAVMTSKSSR